jgi:polysaccharide biosynthesis transport protein
VFPEWKKINLPVEKLYPWVTALRKQKEVNRPPTDEDKVQQGIDFVLGGLTVTPEKNSRVTDITYSSPDPKLATRVVNILTGEYVEYNFQSKFDATSRATDFLQRQLVDLKAKVEASEAALIEYARSHNMLSVGEKQDVVIQTLEYKTLSGATPDNFPQSLRTPWIENLECGVMKDEQELARLTVLLGSAMPEVKQLKSRVGQARQQLEGVKRMAIENARTEYTTALAREKLLAEAFEKQKTLANELNQSNIHYNLLRREVETNKQLYDGLLQRMKEAGVAVGLKSSNIKVVDEARVPDFPSSPDKPRNLALASRVSSRASFHASISSNDLIVGIRIFKRATFTVLSSFRRSGEDGS